jgi:ankyrin repeat protein
MEKLFDSIEKADIPALNLLLQENPDYLAQTNSRLITPLLYSLYMGKPEIAKIIYATKYSFTLHECVAMNDIDRVKKMIDENPSSVNSFSSDGWTSLHLAAFFGHREIVNLLLGNGAPVDGPSRSSASYGNSPLQAATAMSRYEVIKLLLERGANVNFVQQPGGFTPLHIAASRNDANIVRLLIDNSADKHSMTDDGKRPVDIAKERNNTEVVNYLEET